MRMIVSSDWHADRSTLGVSRLKEVRRAVDASVLHAIETKADAYLFLGDLADPDSGGSTFESVAMIIEVAIALFEADIQFIAIAGNHDVMEDGTGATVLAPLASMARGNSWSSIVVAEDPMLVPLGREGSGIEMLCLPYPPIARGYSPSKVATEAMQRARGRVVVAGHLMIPGVLFGEETLEMPRGRDVLFPVEETSRAPLRLNGHYHARQITKEGIVIPGALARFSFGHDEDKTPGFLAIEI